MESASHPTPFELRQCAALVASDLTADFGDCFSAVKALLQALEGQSRSLPGVNAEEGMAIVGGERQGKCGRGLLHFGGARGREKLKGEQNWSRE